MLLSLERKIHTHTHTHTNKKQQQQKKQKQKKQKKQHIVAPVYITSGDAIRQLL